MKVSFWLLDINPKIDKDKGTIELWLWGIDSDSNRVLVVDRNFVAYFYAVVADGFDASKVAEAVMNGYAQSIVKVEVAHRRSFGKPVQTIKVCCKVATETGKVANQLRSVEGIKDCLEDEIRASMRYLIDNNVVPCAWHEVDAIEEENIEGVRVSKVYAAASPPRQLDTVTVPSLRVLGWSMICYSREGSPKPDRNPVLIISTAASNGEEKQFIVDENKNDKPVIEEFIAYICKFDPDIVGCFGANTVDWTYLKGRSHRLKLKLDFDRAKQEPHTSVYGHVSTTGIVNIDLADFIDVFPEVKVKTLWNFADYLGVMKEKQSLVEDVEFADYWDDKQKREELKRFGLDSACKVQGTAALLLDFAMQLAGLTSLPLDYVMTAAVGFRVEWFLIKQAQKIGELIPKRIEQPYRPYTGGLVLSPKPGLHENIAVLDFKSMYPNIMITYNLSPDTYVAPDEPEPASGVYEAPEVKHRFRKAPPGFYKEALTYLINVRSEIRQKMKNLNPRTVEYQVLDARQKAVKVITNAAYGYAGWIGAKWYIKPVAEAASAWGRHIILTSSQMAEKAGITVVYGDTDSLFLSYDESKVLKLKEEIKRELKLDVEVDEVYKRIFFTEAKKRYAGLHQDGSLDLVGLEVIRGDWTEVAKKVQEHVLEIILTEPSPKRAIDYVHSVVADLKHRKVPLHDLIIWKTLTKPPEEYAIKAPHVEAAKILKDKGWRLTGGDKVGYVVLEGKGRLFNRVKPYVFAKINEVDVDYYITNQVLPAAARILVFFNVTQAELLKEAKETEEIRSLMDYV
ncbi:MAG TPA: DNA polymerase domain-containing protein [Candidatus Binatia bacterium]|nr:DNA polymerase domain-containing protein [Candidatus Binatia bacterium]